MKSAYTSDQRFARALDRRVGFSPGEIDGASAPASGRGRNEIKTGNYPQISRMTQISE